MSEVLWPAERPTFVITVSTNVDSEKSASETKAPDSTFAERFLPWKSHLRRSRILSLTAFACNVWPQPSVLLTRVATNKLAAIYLPNGIASVCSLTSVGVCM